MRKSERVHHLCPMDNTHGILKRHAENAQGCLFNCATDDGTSERLPLYMLQEPVQELSPSVAFAITYVSKRFFEVKMATSSSQVFSTKRECLDQNSLELSSSANSSASLLAQVKNSSA